jgi:hypothetical protein
MPRPGCTHPHYKRKEKRSGASICSAAELHRIPLQQFTVGETIPFEQVKSAFTDAGDFHRC